MTGQIIKRRSSVRHALGARFLFEIIGRIVWFPSEIEEQPRRIPKGSIANCVPVSSPASEGGDAESSKLLLGKGMRSVTDAPGTPWFGPNALSWCQT